MPSRSQFPISAIVLMGAGTLVLAIIVISSIWLALNTSRLAEEVTQSRRTRIVVSNTLETLLNAETAQRGYLLTGSERYLGPYNAARSALDRNLSDLAALENGHPGSQPRLLRLSRAAGAKMSELAETIALEQAGRHQDAIALVRTNRGIDLMDDARKVFGDLITDAEQTVTADMKQLNANARLLELVTTIGGALIILFGIAAMGVVFRAVRAAVAARREVESLNVTLEDRVLRRTEALTRANEEIQRFAYIVSHDLRAPLVNIMGFTSELEVGTKALKEYFGQEKEEARPAAREAALDNLPEAVTFIRSSTGKMDRLINAILKLSREGRRELAAERINLKRMFETLVASLKHQIDETSTTVSLAENLPSLNSDRLAIEQVFSNLLDNALKYLQPGRPGRIEIWAENRQDSVVIIVRDNGRGIAENDLERVFELFRRAGRQDRPGEGIGLAHVRALVRRLGGDITVASKLGEGSEFRVLLPRTLPQEPSSKAS